MLTLDLHRLRFYARIYAKLILLQLRAAVEYRADFWIGVVGAVLMNGAGLVFIAAFFSRIPAVAGWSAWEVATLYGLTMIAYGLREMLCDGIWTLRVQINRGEFDRLLVRPLSPALQIVTSLASIHGVGNVLLGLVVFLTATHRLELDWTVAKVLWVLMTVVCGLIMVTAISFLANVIGFWEPGTQSSFPFMVSNVVEFAKFPLELYGWGIRFLVTAVLPYGFVSYYPSLILLDKENPLRWLGYATPLATAAVTFVTAWVWRKGLARYQGVGH
ncbi:MAG: ABC-2 family transporter protein [Chloroflexia bacterium]|nr:ABC-2 family transporter protein [Chloroflexia bacterium]